MPGVFGLKKVYNRQRVDNWSESANYGYFAGGSNAPPKVCTIDRIDFSSETVSLPASSLTKDRNSLGAVSSSNYGYFAGGSPNSCTIDRIDFSSETVVGPPVHGAGLTQNRYGMGAVSNSNYGYFAGGFFPGMQCIIDRIDFSSETVTLLPESSLTEARYLMGSVSSSDYGYIAGGGVPPTSSYYCIIERIDFSSETVVGPPVHGAGLTQARYNIGSVSNSNYGYFAGGYNPNLSPPPYLSTIDRIDFSSETVAVPPVGSQLTEGRGSATGSVSNSNYGYFGGGYDGAGVVTIDRLDFSTETVVAPGTYQLTQARGNSGGVSGGKSVNSRGVRKGSDKDGKGISSTYGYFAGGEDPGATPTAACTIDRLDFYNETVAVPPVGNQLTRNRIGLAAVSNFNYGYFAGGYFPGRYCTIDRIDFSNETVEVPSVEGQLTEAKSYLTGTSNSNYGYFAGGFTSSGERLSNIDRIDFSTETVVGPPVHGANLTQGRHDLAAVSSSNCGYFAGGFAPPSVCTIDRIDFSTETVVGPPVHGASLTEGRDGLAAVSNSNYGYFAGGDATGQVCTIDRLDFSNETILIPASTPQLTKKREFLTSVSNSNYGYFAGGESPPTVATIDRIDFSTETVDGPPVHGANLTQARIRLAGVSN